MSRIQNNPEHVGLFDRHGRPTLRVDTCQLTNRLCRQPKLAEVENDDAQQHGVSPRVERRDGTDLKSAPNVRSALFSLRFEPAAQMPTDRSARHVLAWRAVPRGSSRPKPTQ